MPLLLPIKFWLVFCVLGRDQQMRCGAISVSMNVLTTKGNEIRRKSSD